MDGACPHERADYQIFTIRNYILNLSRKSRECKIVRSPEQFGRDYSSAIYVDAEPVILERKGMFLQSSGSTEITRFTSIFFQTIEETSIEPMVTKQRVDYIKKSTSWLLSLVDRIGPSSGSISAVILHFGILSSRKMARVFRDTLCRRYAQRGLSLMPGKPSKKKSIAQEIPIAFVDDKDRRSPFSIDPANPIGTHGTSKSQTERRREKYVSRERTRPLPSSPRPPVTTRYSVSMNVTDMKTNRHTGRVRSMSSSSLGTHRSGSSFTTFSGDSYIVSNMDTSSQSQSSSSSSSSPTYSMSLSDVDDGTSEAYAEMETILLDDECPTTGPPVSIPTLQLDDLVSDDIIITQSENGAYSARPGAGHIRGVNLSENPVLARTKSESTLPKRVSQPPTSFLPGNPRRQTRSTRTRIRIGDKTGGPLIKVALRNSAREKTKTTEKSSKKRKAGAHKRSHRSQ